MKHSPLARILILVFCVTLSLGITGCGNDEKADDGKGKQNGTVFEGDFTPTTPDAVRLVILLLETGTT